MTWKRRALGWLAGLAVCAVSASPIRAAESFADFRIDAAAMDFPQRSVSVRLYPDSEELSEPEAEWTCTLNRVTGDASFYVQPRAEGVWVSLDCFTDLDGDGVYERAKGVQSPMSPGPTSSSSPRGSRGGWNPAAAMCWRPRPWSSGGRAPLRPSPSRQRKGKPRDGPSTWWSCTGGRRRRYIT